MHAYYDVAMVQNGFYRSLAWPDYFRKPLEIISACQRLLLPSTGVEIHNQSIIASYTPVSNNKDGSVPNGKSA